MSGTLGTRPKTYVGVKYIGGNFNSCKTYKHTTYISYIRTTSHMSSEIKVKSTSEIVEERKVLGSSTNLLTLLKNVC